MTPETDVKVYFRREVAKLEKHCGVPFTVIANPANAQTEIGRPDCDLIINNVLYIHIEFKAEGTDLSLAQEVFADEARYGQFHVCVVGRAGVDSFIERLADELAVGGPRVWFKILDTIGLINGNIDSYFKDKERYRRAVAKRPKRQSSQLH